MMVLEGHLHNQQGEQELQRKRVMADKFSSNYHFSFIFRLFEASLDLFNLPISLSGWLLKRTLLSLPMIYYGPKKPFFEKLASSVFRIFFIVHFLLFLRNSLYCDWVHPGNQHLPDVQDRRVQFSIQIRKKLTKKKRNYTLQPSRTLYTIRIQIIFINTLVS